MDFATFAILFFIVPFIPFGIVVFSGWPGVRLEAAIMGFLMTAVFYGLVPLAKNELVLPYALTLGSIVIGTVVGKWMDNRMESFPV